MYNPASKNETPTKKKQTHLKKQKNTLNNYFQTLKNGSESNHHSVIKTEGNKKLSPLTKRKAQSTNNDIRAKFIKIDDACQNKTLTEKTTAPVDPMDQALVVLGRIDVSKIEKKENILVLDTEFSMNDSVVMDPICTPDQPTTSKNYKPSSCVTMKEVEKAEISRPNEISKIRENSHVTLKYESEKSPLVSPEKPKISAAFFKDIVYSFFYNDFSKPFWKLSSYNLPECYDIEKCKTIHEGSRPREVNSFQYGHIFNILDSPLPQWLCDIHAAIYLVLTREQHLRGDMLRVMFDFILNGPNEMLMWAIETLIQSHWSLHPPCNDYMRGVYLELLDRRYPKESFFKTDLANYGVLLHVLDQMEKVIKPETNTNDICENVEEGNGEAQNSDSSETLLTFELLEERFKNHQPLFEEEHKEMMKTLGDMALSQEEKNLMVLDETERLNRLTIALKLIVDLLEADFMICVSRLKSYMKKECEMREPLIKHFMDDSFQSRIMNLYVEATNKCTWQQLSRIIDLMAETVHLFKHEPKRVWKYPNLDPECGEFASLLFEKFNKGGWDEIERLCRLRTLRPPWLQQRVALAVATSHLNLDLGSGIQAVVDIIHTHIVNPVKLEDLKKVELDPHKLRQMSEKLMKKSKKLNQYGETLLHQLCKNRKSRIEDIECVLALPETEVNAKDNNGWTPLHEAVGSLSLAKTQLLLQYQPPAGKQPVDVGAQNNDGITPLHDAVAGNSLELCQLLVQYGGFCLLRKKSNEGVTPLSLAKDKEEIRKYFEIVIKTQEKLNLNSNSVLKLSDSMMRICMLVCDAFIDDHHTWELHQVLKFDKQYNRPSPQPWLPVCSKEILLEFKQDQDQFRKLRRILEKLVENPENSFVIKLWHDRYL